MIFALVKSLETARAAGGGAARQSTILSQPKTGSSSAPIIPGSRPAGSAKVAQLFAKYRWVDYAPTNFGNETADSIREDLRQLRRAGFTGLVTYGSDGVLGSELPAIAKQEGFDALIMGIWKPGDQLETNNAIAGSRIPIVVGYCVGNEGLNVRYKIDQLISAMKSLRTATGKLVSTTEVVEKYSNPQLLEAGDWVFPNIHPYWHKITIPADAISWTVNTAQSLQAKTSRYVVIKECGVPTAGDISVNEGSQEQYYLGLAQTKTPFVWFEAFDGPWKTWAAVEPYWGIFKADRTPKPVTSALITTPTTFSIYSDSGASSNHYSPSGLMGDISDLQLDEAWSSMPHAGSTCIRVTYTAKGTEGWAGIYWLDPPNNWGNDPSIPATGYDLGIYNHCSFWARAEQPSRITFKIGAIGGPAGDSLTTPATLTAQLTSSWQHFTINTSGDLHHIIGGFCAVASRQDNPQGTIYYLDDIQFVQ